VAQKKFLVKGATGGHGRLHGRVVCWSEKDHCGFLAGASPRIHAYSDDTRRGHLKFGCRCSSARSA